MNEFTVSIFEAAIDELSTPRKRATDPAKVIAEAEKMWTWFRDLVIESHADQILEIGPDTPAYEHLLRIAPKVVELMIEIDYSNGWDDDYRCGGKHQRVTLTAYGLANLRWINRDRAGLEPRLEYTEAEVNKWLEDSRTYQPVLFEVA